MVNSIFECISYAQIEWVSNSSADVSFLRNSFQCGTGEIYALTDAAGPSSLVAEPGSLMLENAPAEKGSEGN